MGAFCSWWSDKGKHHENGKEKKSKPLKGSETAPCAGQSTISKNHNAISALTVVGCDILQAENATSQEPDQQRKEGRGLLSPSQHGVLRRCWRGMCEEDEHSVDWWVAHFSVPKTQYAKWACVLTTWVECSLVAYLNLAPDSCSWDMTGHGLRTLHVIPKGQSVMAEYYWDAMLNGIYPNAWQRQSDAAADDDDQSVLACPLFSSPKHTVFQQDCAPKPHCHLTQQQNCTELFRDGHCWKKDQWLGNSPDLSPVENVWTYKECCLRGPPVENHCPAQKQSVMCLEKDYQTDAQEAFPNHFKIESKPFWQRMGVMQSIDEDKKACNLSFFFLLGRK